jgi:hypothetical protein
VPPTNLRIHPKGWFYQFNRCHPPIQSVPPTNLRPTNLRIHPKGWFYGIHRAGSGFACVGGLGSPVISPSQSSAPLELRPSIIGATQLLNRCHPPISTLPRRRKTPKHPSNRCHPPICDPPIYGYTRKGGFIGSIERGVDSLAWGDWVVL